MEADILPRYELPLRREGERIYVFDPLRKKEILLTPEEFVRQCLIRFFVEEKKVPLGLMSIERGTVFNSLKRRYDLVIFGRDAKPLLCAECKAPEVALDENAFRQISVYNATLDAKYLLLTNGKSMKIFVRSDTQTYAALEKLPEFGTW